MQITINLYGSTREQLTQSLESVRDAIENGVGEGEGDLSAGGGYDFALTAPASTGTPFILVDDNSEVQLPGFATAEAAEAACQEYQNVTLFVPEEEDRATKTLPV